MAKRAFDLRDVRPPTRNLVASILLDTMPSPTTLTHFGLRTNQHYDAVYCAVREGDITPQQLDEAMGDGKQLTALIRGAQANPYKDLEFVTAWDLLLKCAWRDGPGGSEPQRDRREPDVDLDK